MGKSTGKVAIGAYPNLMPYINSSVNLHSNFLYVYFTFAYYMLLVPFRFKNNGGKFQLHRNRLQQVLCALANLLALFRLFTTLRSTILQVAGRNPVSFFLMFCECSSFVFKATVFKIFWFKSDSFEHLINYLNSPYLVPYNPFKIESTKTIGCFCGAYAVLSFLRLAFGSSFINTWDWSPAWVVRRLVAEARYAFFVSPPTSVDSAPQLSDISVADVIITVIQTLSFQSRFITGFFVDLSILVHVLSLWAPTSGFINNIYSQLDVVNGESGTGLDPGIFDIRRESSLRGLELDLVLRQFEALKTLSILIGETIGHVIMPFIGEALFYYAVYFDSVILTPDVVQRMVLMFFYISAVCILIFSAEIVRQMRWLRAWLGEMNRVNLIGHNQLAMILDDLEHNAVGITAAGVFTLNYTFVGTVVSVLITYFIIRLQTTGSV